MKNLLLLCAIALIALAQPAFAQVSISSAKKFDYGILSDKVLLIPEFDANSIYAKKLVKKGKYQKLQNLESYSAMWKKVMAESSYDATPYEIKKFDAKKLYKQKNDKAIILVYRMDKLGNWTANLMVTGPKRLPIASVLINGLDIGDENDLRLMMNMLNYSLNEMAEVEESGDKKKYSTYKKKYYENLSNFYSSMGDMTFLVPKSQHKNAKKAAERNADLKVALKSWTISGYKFTTESEINKLRLAGDQNSYYWKSFNLYTNSPLITYRINYIITTEKDEPVFYFLGSKRLKPKTLDEIQKKIVKKAEKASR